MTIRPQLLIALLVLTQWTIQCPDEKYCLSCPAPEQGKDQVCTMCENSFFNVAKKECDTYLKETVSNCKTYETRGDKVVCTGCDYGYAVDSEENVCNKCKVEGCALCNIKDVCFGCFDKRMLNIDPRSWGTSCDPKVKCDVPNCDICTSDKDSVSCAQCENNFSVNNLTEKKCVQAPSNCYMIDSRDHARCAICNFGSYITKDGQCKSSSSSSWWWLWVILLLVAIALIGMFVYYRMRDSGRGTDGYTVV